MTQSPIQQYKILGALFKDSSSTRPHRDARNALNSLERQRFIYRDRRVGVGYEAYSLTNKGTRALTYLQLQQQHHKPQQTWDQKWRLVLFDIPENMKLYRDSLRYHLRRLGFLEYQYSVFITPYPCEKELRFVLEYYNLGSYVRFITAIDIGEDTKAKKEFGIS